MDNSVTYREVRATIPKDRHDFWRQCLSTRHRVDKYGDMIDCLTFDLGDGYEIDLKLCNGDDDAGPYIDVVLFHDGCEVSCLEPEFEELEGEYSFEVCDSALDEFCEYKLLIF